MNKARLYAIFIAFVISLACMVPDITAANKYVDSAAKGLQNGSSWIDAWTSFSQITGLSPGDTVYISGGPTNNSRTYSVSTVTPFAGSAGHPITYKIGQDSSHNGTAKFNSSGAFVNKGDVIVSGDAGDGQMHFEFNEGWHPLYIVSSQNNVRITYVNLGTTQWQLKAFGGSGLEIDHCYMKKLQSATPGSYDYLAELYMGSPEGGPWDLNKIHDNTFYVARIANGCGLGEDCIGYSGKGFSIYNNVIKSYTVSPYNGNQHQDGFVTAGCSYTKVYNNYLENIANYPLYVAARYDVYYLYEYNNIMVITDPTFQSLGCATKGISVGNESGSTGNSFDRVIVANNLIASEATALTFCMPENQTCSNDVTNSIVANNCSIDGGTFGMTTNGVTDVDNVVTSGSGHFVSYTQFSPNNDYHLLGSDTTFKDQGTSLSSYFTTDKDGVSRPQGSAWDIGPYEYSAALSSSSPAPQAPQPPSALRIR
jgi:hypothetical protein